MRLERHDFWRLAAIATLSCRSPGPPPPVGPASAPSEASAPSATPHSGRATTAPAAPSPEPPSTMRKFEEDVAFLNQHGAAIKVLQAPSGGRIAISGNYQARIMTSALEPGGESLGFVNQSFIEAGKTGTAFDNYGGEDRFWLGPEGGQYALYFAPGKPFEFANWQTPNAFQAGAWEQKAETPTSCTFVRSMKLTNYAKTELALDVERKVSILTLEHVKQNLGVDVPSGVKWVGFSSRNTITNKSAKAWTEDKGLPSIWILGMFAPVPGTRIIAPFEKQAQGEVVNDRYFGKVPDDRLRVNQEKGFVLFKADGRARGKIGLSPARAKAVLGSYSGESHLLTLVRFTKPDGAKRYVNNSWEVSKEPYGGDVSNAYNDGPVAPGQPSLGGFYELESSSPAAALAPGKALEHTHETYHFQGSPEAPEALDALDALAQKVLGVSLRDVENEKL
jgi:hypothetical protein